MLGNSSTVRFAPQRKHNQTATYVMDEMEMEPQNPKKNVYSCPFLRPGPDFKALQL